MLRYLESLTPEIPLSAIRHITVPHLGELNMMWNEQVIDTHHYEYRSATDWEAAYAHSAFWEEWHDYRGDCHPAFSRIPTH
jgi:hypothetical protein